MKKDKILIVGKRHWQVVIIENAMKEIFKRDPKFYIEHIDAQDALVDLCMNQDRLCCVVCFHSNDISGVNFFKSYQQSARVRSIPFILILPEEFRSIIKRLEQTRIVCVEYKNGTDNLNDLSQKIVKAMVERKKR